MKMSTAERNRRELERSWSYWNENEKRSEMKKNGESLEFKKLVEILINYRMVHIIEMHHFRSNDTSKYRGSKNKRYSE